MIWGIAPHRRYPVLYITVDILKVYSIDLLLICDILETVFLYTADRMIQIIMLNGQFLQFLS